ncbi:MAG: hypothetical protein JST83_12800 [Bacteroidetes bacterium]|nr:hypothetical protein [Bacteroidota bacterium]
MKNLKSNLALLLVAIVYLIAMYGLKPYQKFYYADGGDAMGYYTYLPSAFIYHDLDSQHRTWTVKYSHSSPWQHAEVKYFNKYFAGVAVLQAPFFFLAHLLAKPFGQPADGFSMIYMVLGSFSCIFWAWMGLCLISIFLRRYFSDGVTALVVVCIGLATNLYFLVVGQAPMSHAYLFFWYALLVYVSIKFYETERSSYIILIGFICGMITLTRFNELYCVLIPLLWGLADVASIRERVALLKKNWLWLIGAAVTGAVCLLPQIIYWKISVGHYLYYSYTDEKFDFLHPHIWEGLTSIGNGWLPYSPIMIFSLIGFLPTFRQRHAGRISLLVYFVVHVYVIYSWWCFFYMGSYGSRPMTEAYPLLSIPLAYSIQWLLRSWRRAAVFILFLGLCTFQVMMQTYQMAEDIFNSEFNNWYFNVVSFGKTKLTYEESIVLDTKEFQPSHPVYLKTLLSDSLEDSRPGADSTVAYSGHQSVCIAKDSTVLLFKTTAREAGLKGGQWIKASAMTLAKDYTNNNWHKSPLVMMFSEKGHRKSKWRILALQNKIDNPEHKIWHFTVNKWGYVYFYSQVPQDMEPDDELLVYVEHKNGPDICVDDVKVEVYENK